jgi:hypothetical protein
MSGSPPQTESVSGDEKYDDKVGTQSFHSDAVKYDSGVDVAVNLVAGHADDADLSRKEFKRIRARLDWNLLPLLCLLYTRMSFSRLFFSCRTCPSNLLCFATSSIPGQVRAWCLSYNKAHHL